MQHFLTSKGANNGVSMLDEGTPLFGGSEPSFADVREACLDRERARKNRDYGAADQIRKRL